MATRIYLTGRLAVEHGGHARIDERDLPGRQGRLAFVYLVAHRHRPVLRDDLIDVLWPGGEPPEGDTTLSAVLSRLRSLLKRADVGDAGIDVDGRTLSIRLPGDAWVDLESAANAVDVCEGALRQGDRGGAWGHANVAITIATRPLLSGEEAPWITGWRTKLLALRVRALHALVTISAANGEPAVAIQHAEEILAIDPYREPAYQELMRLHAAAGNRAEAFRVFCRCTERLRTELGTKPSSRTEQIWKAIEQS